MSADTYTRTPVALPGYPTDLTPAATPLTRGRLFSWSVAVDYARRLHLAGDPRERTDAALWVNVIKYAKQYVAHRGETPDDTATLLVALAQILAEGRLAAAIQR
jgi:hypothetical protein